MTETKTHGYVADKEALVRRLHRIEGQVRGIERMVDGRSLLHRHAHADLRGDDGARERRVPHPRRPREPLRRGCARVRRSGGGRREEQGAPRGRAPLRAGALAASVASRRPSAISTRPVTASSARRTAGQEAAARARPRPRRASATQTSSRRRGVRARRARANDVIPPGANWGRRLAKKTAIFGLPRLLKAPCRSARAGERGSSRVRHAHGAATRDAPPRATALRGRRGTRRPTSLSVLNAGSEAVSSATTPALAASVQTACPSATPHAVAIAAPAPACERVANRERRVLTRRADDDRGDGDEGQEALEHVGSIAAAPGVDHLTMQPPRALTGE